MNLENISKTVKKGVAVFSLVGALSLTAQAQSVGKCFFECNYWEDTHGDNRVYYPEGYHGMKNDFNDDEDIIFVGHDPGWAEGDNVEYVLYGPNGKVVLKKDITLESDGEWYHAGESSDENLMDDMMSSSNGGDGDYKVVWFTNGEYDGQSEFEISSSSK
jgi:hypothetical protein